VAKLSEEARTARRETIVLAATELFAERGFHATSMAEVIAGSRLAAGTVYQYFGSKDELIVAVAERALDGIGATVASAIVEVPPPPLTDFLREVESALPADAAGRIRAYLVLHSWAETGRNRQLAELVRSRYEAMLSAVGPTVAAWQDRGELPSTLSPAELGRTLLALVQGRIVQSAVFSDP